MDLSIDRDFPELASKFTGADARAAVGIASGDAVRRLNASGGNDGKSAAKAVTGYVERQGDGERADGCGDIVLHESVGFAESIGDSRAGFIAVKANVHIGEDIAVVLRGPAESQDSEAVIASETGARGVATESAHELEAQFLERISELLLLASFKLDICQFGTARHEPGSAVRVSGTHHWKIEKGRIVVRVVIFAAIRFVHDDIQPDGLYGAENSHSIPNQVNGADPERLGSVHGRFCFLTSMPISRLLTITINNSLDASVIAHAVKRAESITSIRKSFVYSMAMYCTPSTKLMTLFQLAAYRTWRSRK